MGDKLVTFSAADSIGTISFNRPPVNSYDIEFMRQLEEAVDQANDSQEAKAVVVRSELEKFFSGGADIKAFQKNSTEENMRMIETAHRALRKIELSPKIFLAAIHGHALGGGLEIALACDFRYAAEGEYSLGLPEATLGLLPGNGGTQRLPRLIGRNRALELMVFGKTLKPAEAYELGIVNGVFSPEELLEKVASRAKRLAAGATLAIGHIKRAVYEGIELPLAEALQREQDLMEPLFDSKDAEEGIRAFVEKRKPAFQGK